MRLKGSYDWLNLLPYSYVTIIVEALERDKNVKDNE